MATRHHAHGFSRSDRIAEQVRRELTDLLRNEVKDPRLAPHLSLLTVTDVEVSTDYSHAKVFYTTLADHSGNIELGKGLDRLAGFLRRELGKRIRLHHTPQLHFVFDSSVERGTHLSHLIDAAVASDHQFDKE
jgi:ribosome-binding factor A